jgi:DNA-binding winged helix-turn-helix (wHTH) protein/TolB-like protein/Flp pilus assembly protein TadD
MTAVPRFSFVFRGFRLDPVEKVLFRDGVSVSLTPKVVETLLALVERHGQLVTKEELLRIVWPDTFVEENNLAQNISMLRRVFGEPAGEGPVIETVPKRGYRFVAPVEKRAHQAEASIAPAAAAPAPAAGPDVIAGGADAPVWRRYGPALAALAVVIVAVTMVVVVRSRVSGSRPGDASIVRPPHVTRMAVLPFVNLGSSDDEYFVAGMTEEVMSRLAGLRSLAVSSATTVTGYDRRGKTVRQIGADLGVEYVVEGSVRWASGDTGTQVRITPKLIRVADDTTVWTQQYDASLSDLFGVQADIAYRITGALQVALEARERRVVDARPTADTDAYLAYLRGITSFQQGTSDTSNQLQARAELERAVARDPRFASAWGWLARVYAWQYNTGALRDAATKASAQRAAERAMALNPSSPEARLGAVQVFVIDRDFESALRELNIALSGAPNSPELWRMVGFVEQRKGNWPESLSAYLRAFDLDPVGTADPLAIYYLHMRQYPEAIRFVEILKAGSRPTASLPDAWTRFSGTGDSAGARQALELALRTRTPADARVRGLLARFEWIDGNYPRALELIGGMDPSGSWMPVNFRYPAALAAGQVHESMGNRDEAAKSYTTAVAQLEARRRISPDDYQIEAPLGLAYAGLGRTAEAIRHAERAVQLLPITKDAAEGPLYLYLLAQTYARVGQAAQAFATLDRMFSAPGFYGEMWVQRDPGFASLRNHPKFRAYVDRWSKQRGDALLKAASTGGEARSTGLSGPPATREPR